MPLPNPTSYISCDINTSSDSTSSSCSTATAAVSSEDSISTRTFPSLPSLRSLLPSNSSLTATLLHLTSLKPLTPNPASAAALSISPSSLLLYFATPTDLSIFDLNSLLVVDSLSAVPTAGAVKSLAIIPSSGDLLTAHQDGLLRVWRRSSSSGRLKLSSSLPTLPDRLLRLPFPKNYISVRRHRSCLWIQHADTVSAVAANSDQLYSVSWDKTLKIWQSSDLRCIQSLTAHDDAINALVIGPDGTVYTGSADTKIRVWSPSAGDGRRHELVATLESHRSAVNALAISGNGSVLYSGSNDRSILVWEREESANHMTVVGALRGHGKAVMCIVCVGEMVFSGSSDRTVRIWRRGREGREYSCLGVMLGHVNGVRSIAAVRWPEENSECEEGGEEEYRVCSGSLDGEVRVWKVIVSGFNGSDSS